MCDCKKDAKVFIGPGNLFWGWSCKCTGKWMTQNIKILSLEDIKPEVIPQAPGDA